ncbi:LIM domain-binding protein 1 isoform X2 [Nilaparvata lugens]|uniref:LIM domain-binding protein 1 isoform X2 n=1 Tax=Nilaparvata lugens TaxID=108931 RepID=UPI00193DCBBD|nr:LIM domain-binding protein 1 isoform X2 [Nilaparvata lugens]
MRQGRGGQRSKKCCSRRVAGVGVSGGGGGTTLEDAVGGGPGGGGGGGAPTWKGGPGPPAGPNQGQDYQGYVPPPPPPNTGPTPFQQGGNSPAGGPFGGGGSTTPQYTASPAPSGSSTPGPPPQGGGFPPPGHPQGGPPNSGPPYNGPFGSPGGGGPPQFRPGSSGPPFGPPGGGGGPPNPHFASPGQQPPPFGGSHQFGGGMPPGSPFGHGGPPPGMPGPHGIMPPGPNPVDRIEQGCVPVPRRHTPYFGQPDYRMYELNKRLQQRTEESDNLWWDAFATEFFEDDATLTLTFCLEDGPKRYTIGRTLIPRYFRSIFEGGVTELYYNLKHPKESFHNTSITLDCDQCTMVTHHGKPMFTKVCTEGRLILEFTFDDLMRIKSWHLAVRTHRELVPRSVVSMHSQQQDPQMLDQLAKNITRQGITNSTLNYLRLCVILEPMQELMSRHKAYALSPRDCLKTTLFQKWQRMVAPPESQRPANKRRKRKGSQGGAAANNAPPVPNKKRSPGPNFSLASQDVMVVGEPSLMGGEFGDEDERLITRLENTQYDAAAVVGSVGGDHHGVGGVDGGPGGPPSFQGPGRAVARWRPGSGGGPPTRGGRQTGADPHPPRSPLSTTVRTQTRSHRLSVSDTITSDTQ